MKTKTEEKWVVINPKNNFSPTFIGTPCKNGSINYDQVAKVNGIGENYTETRNQRAKLIAAAPEMLEALNNAIHIIEIKCDGFGVNELKDIVKKAIS